MASLAISIDDTLLKRARIKALEEGISVNALLRDYLERYAGMGTTAAALGGFAELAEASEASSGPQGRAWRREELHDRSSFR